MPKKNAELKEDVVTLEVIDDSIKEPQSPAEAMIAPLTLYDQKLVEFSPYKDLTINGLGDKEGYKKVDAARKEVKRTKIEVEKVADSILDPIVKLAQQVRDKKKEYIEGFKSIEKGLEEKVSDYDRKEQEEKSRIEREAEERFNRRLDQIVTIGAKFNGHTSYKIGEVAVTSQELRTLSDENFIKITSAMEVEYAKELEERQKEEQRLAEEKKLREAEAEKQRLEAETLRAEKEKLEQEKAEMQKQLEAQKTELEAELKKVREEAANAERERIRKEREEEQKRVEHQQGTLFNVRSADLFGLNEEVGKSEDGIFTFRGVVLTSKQAVLDIQEGLWGEYIEGIKAMISNRIDQIKKEHEEAQAEAVKSEQDRLAAEKAAAEREDLLKPDKQKLTDAAGRIKDFPTKLAFTSPEAKAIHEQLKSKMEQVAEWLIQSVETL